MSSFDDGERSGDEADDALNLSTASASGYPASAEPTTSTVSATATILHSQPSAAAAHAAAATSSAAGAPVPSRSSHQQSSLRVRPPSFSLTSPSPSLAQSSTPAHAASAAAPASSGAAACPAPSTLSLLHSIQSLHQLTSHLQQTLSHYLSAHRADQLELEEQMQRVKYIEHMLRLLREASGGAPPLGGLHGSAQQLLASPQPIVTAFASTSTSALLGLYATQSYAHLFDARRISAACSNKPFSWGHEQEYRRLIHLIRWRPSLLAFALATFPWHTVGGGGSGAGAGGDASLVSFHRKSMEAVSQCVVWDVFGNYAPAPGGASGGGGAGGSAGGGAGGMGGGGGSSSDGGTADATHVRKVAYLVRLTMRIMWERESERMLQEQHQREGIPLHPSSSSPVAVAPLLPPPPPSHLFDHHSFLPKLLHEFRSLAGGEFLLAILRDILHVLLACAGDEDDLSQDLMTMLPHPATDTSTSSGSSTTTTPFSPLETEKPGRTPGPGVLSPVEEGSGNAAAAASSSVDPLAAALASFPPSSSPPLARDSPSASSPPKLHGRSSANLFDLCTTLLEKLDNHVETMPRPLRRLARDMARLCHSSTHGSSPSSQSTSPPPLSAADLLPEDPCFELYSTRLLGDFFFLHWIVHALLFPESYWPRAGASAGGAGGMTDNFPVTAQAKRNLQAIATVLIKLTSGSRFGGAGAAAQKHQHQQQQQNHDGSSNETSPATSRRSSISTDSSSGTPISSTQQQQAFAPISRLDRFLQIHQPRVHAWLRRVIDLDEDGLEDHLDKEEFERQDLGRDVIAVPAGWDHDPASDASENTFVAHELSLPPVSPSPILLLPNDLFALHGLLRGCWNQAVTTRVASTPRRSKAGAAGAAPAAQQPTPIPFSQLPLPSFPSALRAVSSTGLNHSCPYSLPQLSLLLGGLSSLGDVPPFVPGAENVYLLLDGGIPPLMGPRQLGQVRTSWPFDRRELRHAGDLLLAALESVPPLVADAAQRDPRDLQAILGDLERQHAPSLFPSVGPMIHATFSALRAHLPPQWAADGFRPFLFAVQRSLLSQYSLLSSSPALGQGMLLHYGATNRMRALGTSKESWLLAQFRAVQTKRLLELTRPKIKRLKKFLAAKTAPQPQPQAPAAISSPLPPFSTPASSSSEVVVGSSCSGACPDNISLDRFLCNGCSRLLERRRGLLKSFMSKYVVGEGVVTTSSGGGGGGGGNNGAGMQQQQPRSSPTAGNAVGNNMFAPAPAAAAGGLDVPAGSPTPPSASSSSSSLSSLLVSIGVGPPLDLRDPAVSSDIQDYIGSLAYPELFVRCALADDSLHRRLTRLAQGFSYDFRRFFVFMQVLDAVRDPAEARATYKKWLLDFETRFPTPPIDSGQGMAASIDELGARLCLLGHPGGPILVSLPSGGCPLEVHLPYLGAKPFFQAYACLRSLDAETKPKRKLALCVQVRSLLLTTLASTSFSALGSSQPAAVTSGTDEAEVRASAAELYARIARSSPFSSAATAAPNFHPLASEIDASAGGVAASDGSAPLLGGDDLPAGSVEDYMSALCFLLLVANPPWLLSSLHFLRSFLPTPTGNCKAAVDLAVAVKYLDGLEGVLGEANGDTAATDQLTENGTANHVASEAANEVATANAGVSAAAVPSAADLARRESRLREEEELQRQAHDLSRQIQEMQLQQQSQLRTATGEVPTGGAAAPPALAATSAYALMAATPVTAEQQQAQDASGGGIASALWPLL